jgi:hypothetical protein
VIGQWGSGGGRPGALVTPRWTTSAPGTLRPRRVAGCKHCSHTHIHTPTRTNNAQQRRAGGHPPKSARPPQTHGRAARTRHKRMRRPGVRRPGAVGSRGHNFYLPTAPRCSTGCGRGPESTPFPPAHTHTRAQTRTHARAHTHTHAHAHTHARTHNISPPYTHTCARVHTQGTAAAGRPRLCVPLEEGTGSVPRRLDAGMGPESIPSPKNTQTMHTHAQTRTRAHASTHPRTKHAHKQTNASKRAPRAAGRPRLRVLLEEGLAEGLGGVGRQDEADGLVAQRLWAEEGGRGGREGDFPSWRVGADEDGRGGRPGVRGRASCTLKPPDPTHRS